MKTKKNISTEEILTCILVLLKTEALFNLKKRLINCKLSLLQGLGNQDCWFLVDIKIIQ